MCAFMDEVRYNDRGNEVTLVKRFPPKHAAVTPPAAAPHDATAAGAAT
jgi:hypothetical protein